MSGADRPPSLKDLDARLKAAREAQSDKPAVPNAAAQGLRLALEMASAVAVGGVIGWALDRWLGTTPWLIVVFVLLGLAAGVRNVYRVSLRMQPPGGSADAAARRDGDPSDKT